MFFVVRDNVFYVETAIGLMTTTNMFESSWFETIEEAINWIESYEINDYDIYEITKY
jgi:hypothetical protein